jgi:hypothetical protein
MCMALFCSSQSHTCEQLLPILPQCTIHPYDQVVHKMCVNYAAKVHGKCVFKISFQKGELSDDFQTCRSLYLEQWKCRNRPVLDGYEGRPVYSEDVYQKICEYKVNATARIKGMCRCGYGEQGYCLPGPGGCLLKLHK